MRFLSPALFILPLLALERPGVEFRIFQFPPDRIPSIDGKTADWDIVPAEYSIGMDQLKETVKGLGFKYDKADLDVRVLFRLSWKWRERSPVKITERTREERTEELHGRRESGHSEAAPGG